MATFPMENAMNPWIIIAWLISLIFSAAAGWGLHADHVGAKAEKKAVEVIGQIKQAQQSVDALASAQQSSQEKQASKDRIITREVIKYVEVVRPGQRCILPGAWRVRHDAAATGNPTESTGLADEQAETVDDAGALETVAENYRQCRHYAEQVAGWQVWWATVCPVNGCGRSVQTHPLLPVGEQ